MWAPHRVQDVVIFVAGLGSVLLLLDAHSAEGIGSGVACFAAKALQTRFRGVRAATANCVRSTTF
jgi:hypothetical protein